jgi:YVTN family beta-propeller protein
MTARTSSRIRTRRTALAATIAFLATAGTVLTHADGAAVTTPAPSAFVPITPCRLLDTRPAPDNVGPRSTPLRADETFVATVVSSNGHCHDLPSDATGVSMNVTIIEPTASSFLTVFPADAATRPLTANLTWTAKQAPTPNAVTSALSADGKLAFYNLSGTVNLAVDVVGYYEPSSGGSAGPRGPKGDQGDPGPAGAAGPKGDRGPAGQGNRISNAQIARLRWDQDPGKRASVPVAGSAYALAFDGTNIWVTNNGSGTVSKINPATNTVIATVTTPGPRPEGIAFDGTNIWVANSSLGTVSRINPTTNTVIDSITVGTSPEAIAFDGTNIWVTNHDSGSVTKIFASTSGNVGLVIPPVTITVGTHPFGIAFDGTNIWVANSGSASLSKINPTTNSVATTTLPIGDQPTGLAFDGQDLWVALGVTETVLRLDVTTGLQHQINVGVGFAPFGLAYDGSDIWFTGYASAFAARIDHYSELVTAEVGLGFGVAGLAFDGSNIWVAHSGFVSKLHP